MWFRWSGCGLLANFAVRFEQWMHHVFFKTSSFAVCESLSHVPELITGLVARRGVVQMLVCQFLGVEWGFWSISGIFARGNE